MQCLYIAHAEDEGCYQGSLLEGDEEQRIASIGDWYAVWIGIDGEHASLAVFIVR